MKKVFVDGGAGTTGLRINERLALRDDIELIILPETERKDTECRRRAINSCDIAFLCLPDDAAREAVQLTDNPNVVIFDTSTAHRTNQDWAYGFPELSNELWEKVKGSKRIAVPGCHASGFIALVYPLLASGVISPNSRLVCQSITGYSGGGKKMIAEYQSVDRSPLLCAPRQYGLSQQHKHLKEMTSISGLMSAPFFSPIVADFYSGMAVTVPLFKADLQKNADAPYIRDIYRKMYAGPVVRFKEDADEGGFLSALALSGKDTMEILVYGNEDRILLTARYDNLGKGASGAAVECMNIVLGIEPTKGLEV